MIRKGRAWIVCAGCGKDVTMDLIYMADAGIPLPPEVKPKEEKKP